MNWEALNLCGGAEGKVAWVRANVIWRILLVLVALLGCFGEFNQSEFLSVFARWPPGAPAPVGASRWASWDAAHYLMLSQRGYQEGSPSCAFYPLWPGAIRLASLLTGGDPLVASLLLSNLMALIAAWLFYRMAEQRLGRPGASDALSLMLAFPGALFFALPYTESAYLCMVLVFCLELGRGRYFWPSVMGFLAPLTKAIGLFLIVPLAWHLWEHRKNKRYWPLLLVPLAGWFSYLWLMRCWTGDAFAGFSAQRAFPNSPSIQNMFNLPHLFFGLIYVDSLQGMMYGALDRVLFVLFLILLPRIFRLDRLWFFYALPAGLVPALTSWFMSYRRYIMVCFPVFIVLAQMLANTRPRWLFWYYLIVLGALQAWAVMQFVNFNWAG